MYLVIYFLGSTLLLRYNICIYPKNNVRTTFIEHCSNIIFLDFEHWEDSGVCLQIFSLVALKNLCALYSVIVTLGQADTSIHLF